MAPLVERIQTSVVVEGGLVLGYNPRWLNMTIGEGELQ